ADVGSTVRVVVTGTNSVGNAAATSQPSTIVQPAPPVNTVTPSVSGAAQQGGTRTADKGTWTGTPAVVYTYQWRRCDTNGLNCLDIAGATGTAYDLAPADGGHTMRVTATGTNAVGTSSADSPPTGVVQTPPANTSAPTISGDPKNGSTLTVDNGTWSGTG